MSVVVVAAVVVTRKTRARSGRLDSDGANYSPFPAERPDYILEPIVGDHILHCEPDAPDKESRARSNLGRDLDFIIVWYSVRLRLMSLGEVSIGDLAHKIQHIHETRHNWKKRRTKQVRNAEAWIRYVCV